MIHVHMTTCSFSDPFPHVGMPLVLDGKLVTKDQLEAESLIVHYASP